ncbi:hypothetical protein C1Y63_05315 [Corynebacterium sp. 13CS0277]|nr:hypothetical protein C1Y63_05315 [Corynebacterium sp. 13CS0277]
MLSVLGVLGFTVWQLMGLPYDNRTWGQADTTVMYATTIVAVVMQLCITLSVSTLAPGSLLALPAARWSVAQRIGAAAASILVPAVVSVLVISVVAVVPLWSQGLADPWWLVGLIARSSGFVLLAAGFGTLLGVLSARVKFPAFVVAAAGAVVVATVACYSSSVTALWILGLVGPTFAVSSAMGGPSVALKFGVSAALAACCMWAAFSVGDSYTKGPRVPLIGAVVGALVALALPLVGVQATATDVKVVCRDASTVPVKVCGPRADELLVRREVESVNRLADVIGPEALSAPRTLASYALISGGVPGAEERPVSFVSIERHARGPLEVLVNEVTGRDACYAALVGEEPTANARVMSALLALSTGEDVPAGTDGERVLDSVHNRGEQLRGCTIADSEVATVR